jgi:transcriptional regulator with XRE-family HTH domain
VNEVTAEVALSTLGPRLAALRQDRGISLRELGRRTGISASTLSRLETGQRRATLELLLPIAGVHGVTLDALLGRSPEPRPHTEPEARTRDVIAWRLSRSPGQPVAYKVVYLPTYSVPSAPGNTHEGRSWFYVLAGRMRAVVDGRDMVLGQGESLEIDTRRPHWTGSTGEGPVELLVLFGRQGEQIRRRDPPLPPDLR